MLPELEEYKDIDECNKLIDKAINTLRKVEADLAVLCTPIIKTLVKEGWLVDDVWDQYWPSVRECLMTHNDNRKNFLSFLRNHMRWRLVDNYRNVQKKDKVFEEKLKFYLETFDAEAREAYKKMMEE